MKDMLKAMKSNFEGFDQFRHDAVYETPKWGNNDDNADRHAVMVFNSYYKLLMDVLHQEEGHLELICYLQLAIFTLEVK